MPAMASYTTTPSDLLHYTADAAVAVAAGTPIVDDLLRNVYPPMAPVQHRAEEEAWGEMAAERKDEVGMTLEDFLAKEGVREEEFRVSPVRYSDFGLQGGRFVGVPPLQVQQAVGQDAVDVGAGLWRGKRRAALLEPLAVDRVTQQRQRRMIKNRESAARSRERKQAYTIELESSVTRLEDGNSQLLKQMGEERKARLKKLRENIIPVTEMRRPPRRLRRTQTMSW